MHKKFINFKIIEFPHSTNNILNNIMHIIREYRCERKIRLYLKQTLFEMYKLYAQRMGTNISWAPSTPTPPANLEEDNTEILNLFEGANYYRYDAVCSFSVSSSKWYLI